MTPERVNRLLRVPAVIIRVEPGPLDDMNVPTEVVTEVPVCCYPTFNLPAEEYAVKPTPETAGQVVLRVGTTAAATDRLVVQGVTYEIEGDTIPWTDPKTNTTVAVVTTFKKAR